MAFCGNCGAAMGDNDKFCGKCGASAVGLGSAIQAPAALDPGQGAGAKLTSVLPENDAFAASVSSAPGGPASKLTSVLPESEAFEQPSSAGSGAGMAPKVTSMLPGGGGDSNSLPNGFDESAATVALLNVSKKPGYEASNAYLDGKDSAASANPFGTSSSPLVSKPDGGSKLGDLPVFGAGAAASAAFGSAHTDAPKGYPFGEQKDGGGLKSSDLGPFNGGPAVSSSNRGVIGLKNDDIPESPVPAAKQPGSLVGNVGSSTSAIAQVPQSSAAVDDDGADIKDHLITSIVVALCCCTPVGIASCVFSAMCRSKKSAGDIAGALQMSNYAKICNFVGMLGFLLMLIFYFVMGVLNN